MTSLQPSDLSRTQGALLLALSLSRSVISGDTAFQKIVFVLSQIMPELKAELDFDSDFYGPFSECAREQLIELIQEDLIAQVGDSFKLTASGLVLAKKVAASFSESDKQKIADTAKFFSDLSLDELLAVVYVTYPDYTKESLIYDKVMRSRVNVAIQLYNREKVSAARAAELAGLPLESFLKLVTR